MSQNAAFEQITRLALGRADLVTHEHCSCVSYRAEPCSGKLCSDVHEICA